MTPITKFEIYPNFYNGFEYTWEINEAFSEPFPWRFVVEQGATPFGDFIPASPTLENVYKYQEDTKRLVNKDSVLHFRLKFIVGEKIYYSDVIEPTMQLPRDEFLMVRKMMHDEYIGQRNHVGVPVDLWVRSVFGPTCTTCTDPITKDVLRNDCPDCFGIGVQPGYHGPYTTWCTFSPIQKQKGLTEDRTGPITEVQLQGRLTAVPGLKKDDIIVDKGSGRCYYIDLVSNVAEMRRVPIAQQVGLKQIPTSDFVYSLVGK